MEYSSTPAVILNPGPLTGISSMNFHFSNELNKLREAYVLGQTPKITLDLRELLPGKIDVPSLAALLSIMRKLSMTYGHPIETYFPLNTKVQKFLRHLDFFEIAKKLQILSWDPKTVAPPSGIDFNPQTKILYYSDIQYDSYLLTNLDINDRKALLKKKIGPHLKRNTDLLFQNLNTKFTNTVINTTLELITNSLIHAREIAFIGLSRTSNKVIVSVNDCGIGFRRSIIEREEIKITNKDHLTNAESIFIGSLLQTKMHGLRLAINEVLNFNLLTEDFENNEGYVNISSFNAEIRWQKYNWSKCIDHYGESQIKERPILNDIIGEKINSKINREELEYKGYWKEYNSYLSGTRITFTIML